MQNINLQKSNGTESKTPWSDLDAFYLKVEKEVLNPNGYIPVVGTAVGVARIALGLAQGSIAQFGSVYELLAGTFTSDRANSIRHYDGFGANYEHGVHGILNCVRGVVELVPFLPLITCVPWDQYELGYSYRSELKDHKIVPIESKDFIEPSFSVSLDSEKQSIN